MSAAGHGDRRGNRHCSRLAKPGLTSENGVWEQKTLGHAALWPERAKSEEGTRESGLSLVEEAEDRVLEGKHDGDVDLLLGQPEPHDGRAAGDDDGNAVVGELLV
jgi:hypothetical protein